MQNETFSIATLVVVALPEEMKGLMPLLPEGTTPKTAGDFTIHVYKDRLSQEHTTKFGFWIVWEMGPEAILLKLPKVIEATSPSLVVNVGIAGMMSGDAKIGDVVLADQIDYYAYRGALDDGPSMEIALKLGGKDVPCEPLSCKRAKNAYEKSPELWRSIVQRSEKVL